MTGSPAARSLTDRLNWALMSSGWALGRHLPGPVRAAIVAGGSRAVARVGPRYLDTYRRNLEVALGRPVAEGLVQRGLASYLRMWTEVLALPGWSPEKVVAMVATEADGERALRAAAAGPGAVVALPHTGNWDLAGAWACATGLPVSTVAEELPEREFAAFTGVRERLGLRVYGHRQPNLLDRLADDVAQGRVVCLLADRNLAGRGVSVDWSTPLGPVPVAMPGGPALLARRTGATLIGAASTYRGRRMHLRFSRPVPCAPGRQGVTTMTQALADFFSMTVRRQPQDWHLMQPFFAAPPPGTVD